MAARNIQPMAVVHAGRAQHFHAWINGGEMGSLFKEAAMVCVHGLGPALRTTWPPSPLPFIGAHGIGGIIIYMPMTVPVVGA